MPGGKWGITRGEYWESERLLPGATLDHLASNKLYGLARGHAGAEGVRERYAASPARVPNAAPPFEHELTARDRGARAGGRRHVPRHDLKYKKEENHNHGV